MICVNLNFWKCGIVLDFCQSGHICICYVICIYTYMRDSIMYILCEGIYAQYIKTYKVMQECCVGDTVICSTSCPLRTCPCVLVTTVALCITMHSCCDCGFLFWHNFTVCTVYGNSSDFQTILLLMSACAVILSKAGIQK